MSVYRISISCTFPAARPTCKSHVLSQYWRGTGPFSSEQNDPARTRTWNLLIRSQTPSPLGHEADWIMVQSPLILTICTTVMHWETYLVKNSKPITVLLRLHVSNAHGKRQMLTFAMLLDIILFLSVLK